MAQYFLGVDTGNTKSHALIVDESGQAVGFGSAGPGNHESLGVDGFTKVLCAVVDRALEHAQITVTGIAGAGFGIAGYDWPSDRSLMDRAIGGLGLNAPYDVVNDAMIGLVAGATEGWGVSISAGTSSNARGRDRNGKIGRMIGSGSYFGEYGGGHELVDKAAEAIGRAWSKRGEETALTDIFVRHVGANDVDDFLEGLVRERYTLRATDAPLVFDAASNGDRVAQGLIKWIGCGLGDLAVGIIHQLSLGTEDFEVVLAGSFYNGSPLVAETMREVIHPIAPGAKLVRLDAPPVVGAALLGMERAGVDFVPVRTKAITTTTQLLHTITS
jgi:N-acetylglucosamine kinase-like BadF-type ATPase